MNGPPAVAPEGPEIRGGTAEEHEMPPRDLRDLRDLRDPRDLRVRQP
ncbi:hypothetical protein FHS01_005712 [Longimicrobium terrae]|uniref:Uncharacterized protein n=1 Tax=Longimicrobium terrae TaxID=1639882 RepID=A0A841H7C2_9BACT|nr:hypothetical protein [Longimicrobium terrae]MBB6074030.1 hypothetical protein [Longimicrobium terrae]